MTKIRRVKYFLLFLLLFYSLCLAEPKEIRILYINDFHGFAESHKPLGSEKPLGGVSYLAGIAKRLRSEKPSLLLSAGDMIQGNNWANLTKGQSVIELMNMMEFDAMTVGNHEFDFGVDVLKKRVSEANFPVLGANIQGLDFLKPYTLKALSGIRILIIGVTTEETTITTHQDNVKDLKFLPVGKTVEKYIRELKGRFDIVIVLSHIGLSADRLLAESVKGIDLILGGHSHTKIERPVLLGQTVIGQAWEYGKGLGVLDLVIENGNIKEFKGHLEEINPENGIEDNSVKTVVDNYKKIVDASLDNPIGTALEDLDGENIRKRETNLGNFITDIIKQKAGTDVSMINGGSIRTGIKKGEIKTKDVYSVLPFDNYIVAIRMSGRKIKEALEHGVSAVEDHSGRFPQVSGIKFTYNPRAPSGNRIREVYIGDKPLEPDKEYSVATNDFLAVGGDGYKAFYEVLTSSKDFAITGGAIKGEGVIYSDASRFIRDIVVEYIREKKVIRPKIEGRIREVSDK